MQKIKDTPDGGVPDGEIWYVRDLPQVDAILKRRHVGAKSVIFCVTNDNSKPKHPNWIVLVDTAEGEENTLYGLREVRNSATTDHIGIKPYDVQ